MGTRDGTAYNPDTALNVRGTETTRGEINAKLRSGNHEAEDEFQATGDGVNVPYDGILGKGFLEDKRATTDYAKKEILMGTVMLKCDDERPVREQLEKH
jgi:hypothetical protein